ncbi:hypothetical protein BDN70DRAFT_602840 [Pholiota conissans]|uniref:Uncharacterized protein n=1 Tax=Pholiota conissans TaxID=109636 RepID=A0A9P6D2D6_9AGAR|nr:hypothetical protein BDN70DRAFT_602840 [Pholiota conissans]
MSSPIAIRRPSTSSDAESSVASSSSPTRALYVPLHKRSPSASPSSVPSVLPSVAHAPTYTYSPDYLLSLRPNADGNMKEKMLAACPEAVMNRRVRKRIEFTARPKHVESTKSTTETPAETTTMTAPAPPAPRRTTARHMRFTGRAPERRKQALGLHQDTWRGLRNTFAPLPLVST